MKIQNFADVSMAMFIVATLLLATDVIILGVVSFKAIVSNFNEFWPIVSNYFLKSRYVILHIAIVFLFIIGFLLLHFAGGNR